MRMLRGKFQGPQLSVNQAQGSLHYHQWIELPFLGSCLLPESRAGEKSLADRQWLELIHSIRNSSVLDLASLLDMSFLKLWTLQMTSTENRTRFPYAKFFVMHSILLYSSLRLSFKNHPSSGLDFSDPGKLPEGRVKPGAVCCLRGGTWLLAWEQTLRSRWWARLISSTARSLQELLPSPGTHPPPQRPIDSPDLKGLLKCTWILSQSFVDHSIHQFLDFPSGHKRQEAGETAPFLFLVISAVITTQWEWEQQQWSPPLKEYLPCTSSHAKGLYMMSLYLHIIKKHYSHFTDEETEALRG